MALQRFPVSKLLVLALCALAWAGAGGLASLVHADPTAEGTDLMEQVDARPRGSDELLHATWRLISKSGRERVRETRSYWLDLRGAGDDLRSTRLLVFDTPTQLEDTAFLVWSNGRVETDDQRWAYLPALRKTRRIAGRDRGKAFAGTDFNYEDLSDLHVDEELHRLEGRDELEGIAYWVVSSTPRDEHSPYSKRVRWIHPEQLTPYRVEFYDRHDRPFKTLELTWQRAGDIWVWERLVMRNRDGHQTVIEVRDAEHDLGMDERLFSQHRLRNGPPRFGRRRHNEEPAAAAPEADSEPVAEATALHDAWTGAPP